MAFIENIPEEAYETLSWANVSSVVTAPTKSSVSASIKSEEAEEKNVKREELKKWLSDRANARKNIFTGRMSSWNKWLDNAEIRKGRITDLARWALEDMWKDPEAIKRISDDDLIKRLVGWVNWTDMKKLNAVNGYMQNWWYAEDVFNYLVWNTSSVYEKMWEPEEKKSAVRNFFWAAVSTPVESAAWISDLIQKNVKYGWKSIYDINKESDIAWLWNIIWNVSEDRYQQYKKWELASKWYQPYNEAEMPQNIWAIGSKIWLDSYSNELDFYKSYDEAKKAWFDWNVEQYGNYVYNMAKDTYNSTAEKVRDYLWTEVYDKEWTWAWAWKLAWEIIELVAFPAWKLKYLKYAPEASKLVKTVKTAGKLWLEWVEMQALEDVYNADLSSIGKYWTTALWNTAIWWVLKWVWSVIWKPSQAAQTALWTRTTKELNEMKNIVQTSLKDYNAKVTPQTIIKGKLENAMDRLLWDRLSKWKELWDIRNFELKYKEWAKYTSKNAIEEDINKSLMQQASKKRFWWIAAKKSEIPQFKFTKNWLEVSNPDVLNNISRNEWWQTVKLWDEIKKVYSETYWAWASVNAATTEKFLRRLDNVFWEAWWSWWPENFINLMKEGIESATKKFDSSLTEETLTKLKNARAADKEAIRLYNAFKKIIWNLEWVEWIWAAEKATKQTATTQELFKKVLEATSKDWKWAIDLNNEIWAWVSVMSAYDTKAAQKLIESIYPSQPWAMEFIIKSVLWGIKKKRVMQSAKDYTPSVRATIWRNIWWITASRL